MMCMWCHGFRVWSVLEVSQSFGVVLLVAAQLSRGLSTPQPPSKAQYLQCVYQSQIVTN